MGEAGAIMHVKKKWISPDTRRRTHFRQWRIRVLGIRGRIKLEEIRRSGNSSKRRRKKS